MTLSLQKVDTTNKPAKRFESELNIFTDFIVKSKVKYLKLFSEDNPVIVECIDNER